MSKTEIFVVGVPRSGNTHTARTLGDVLNAPVTGMHGAHPIAKEGLDRPDDFRVYQLHLVPTPVDCGSVVPDPRTFSLPRWNDERIVLVLRDPRDVAVSMLHYWEMPDLKHAIRCLADPYVGGPISVIYKEFINLWMNIYDDTRKKMVAVKYERLIAEPEVVLPQLFYLLDIPYKSERIPYAIEKNKFTARKIDIEKFGDDRTHYPSYHKGIQDKNLRKGISGDWKNCFTKKLGQYCQELVGDLLLDLGYESDPEWYKALPDG